MVPGLGRMPICPAPNTVKIGLEVKLQANFDASAGQRGKLFQQGRMVVGQFVGQVVSTEEELAGRISGTEVVRRIGTEQRMGRGCLFMVP